MRTSHTVGVISAKLIKTDNYKVKKQEDTTYEALVKLPIIKGGIETRFIPGLSKETKDLIEGFFKITQDVQLRELALSDPSLIELSENDILLNNILGKNVEQD